jgi:hypothetical protein
MHKALIRPVQGTMNAQQHKYRIDKVVHDTGFLTQNSEAMELMNESKIAQETPNANIRMYDNISQRSLLLHLKQSTSHQDV